MTMVLSPTFSGTLAMLQLADPNAMPEGPALQVQLTCMVPEPPHAVPSIATAEPLSGLDGI